MSRLADLDPASRRLITTLVRLGPLPRALLARATGLSSGSVTRLTRPLVETGILRELTPVTEAVGRPSVPLAVDGDAAHFIGIKVVRGAAYALVTGLGGRMVDRAESAIDTSTPETAARGIAGLARRMAEGRTIEALGLGLAAAVDPCGELRAAPLLGWSRGNLQAMVSRLTGIPAISANDVNALALGHHWFEEGRGASNFVTVTVGTGVGAGALVNGELAVGFEGAASMLGEAWLPDGRTFHAVLSIDGIEERIGTLLDRRITFQEIVADASPPVQRELDSAATALGRLVTLVTLAYNPDRVLLTGDGIGLLKGRSDLMWRSVEAHRFYNIDSPTILVRSSSPYAWALGAAAIAIRGWLLYPHTVTVPHP